MRLEELPARPHLRPRMHLRSFVRSGSSGTRYKKTVCLSVYPRGLLFYTITAIPYMCRLLTEGRFGLSHVPVLSSSPNHAIVSQRSLFSSHVTNHVVLARQLFAELGRSQIKLTYFGHIWSVRTTDRLPGIM